MAAISTSIEETGLHEGTMHAWKPKKGKSPVEMLKIFTSSNSHSTLLISNETKLFEKDIALYTLLLSRILPLSIIQLIFTKSSSMQILLPEADRLLWRTYLPMLVRPHMSRCDSPDIGIFSFILTNSQKPRCLPRQVNGKHLPYNEGTSHWYASALINLTIH